MAEANINEKSDSIERTGTKNPVCLIVLGMAGSGKTSLVHRLSNSEKKPYIVNLDPACLHVPYFANIGKICLFEIFRSPKLHFADIRDTVNYKEVMKQYGLGPNGGIVTALNLFSTKFPEVLQFIEKATNEICLLDTPGQIEVFTWSVSGNLNLITPYPSQAIFSYQSCQF